MATGMKTIDLRWPDAKRRFAKAVPTLIKMGGFNLSDREREILLKAGEGKSAEQIGREVTNPLNGKPISRARVHGILHRAIRRALEGEIARRVEAGETAEQAWVAAEKAVFE